MASTRQKIEYLQEHVAYEVMMLRHSYQRLHATRDQLDWNAFLSAFAEAAHNLVEFFKTGHSNARATDYVTGFKPPPREDLYGALRKLDQQIRHLAKERTTDPRAKFRIEHAAKVQDWIEQALVAFTDALQPPYPKDWLPPTPGMIKIDPSERSGPSGSSWPTMTFLEGQSTATIEWFRAPKGEEK